MRSLLLAFILAFCSTALQAQRNTLSGGGEAGGTGGSVSYSIGQLDHQAVSSNDGTVQQGVQQPYEWLVMHVDEEAVSVALIQPNPTNEGVNLSMAKLPQGDATYVLTDDAGRLVSTARITDTNTAIDLSHQPSGTYFVNVRSNTSVLFTARIIKH